MKRLFLFRSVFPRLFGITPRENDPIYAFEPSEHALAVPSKPVERPDVNPLVEFLINCQTDAERAQWLLNVPLGFVVTRHKEINDALKEAGYHNGITYLSLLLAVLSQRRDDDGFHTLAMSRQLDRAAVYVRLDVRPDRALIASGLAPNIVGGPRAAAGSEKA